MGACNQLCQLVSFSSRCVWTRLLVCPGATPASSPQAPSAGRRHRVGSKDQRCFRPGQALSLLPNESRHSLRRGRQQGWRCPDCPGKDLLPQGARATCPHSCRCLFLKSSLLQPGSWPFLFPSSPHYAGLSSHIPCGCVTLSFTCSLQMVARALEQQSQDALLTSIFTVLCEDSNWGLC